MSRLRGRRGRLLMAAVFGLVALAALLIGARWAYVKYQDGRLMRALPSQILADPGLRRFAAWRAGPVLRSRCAACHGGRLQGDPVRGAPNLVDREWVYGDGEVSEIERTLLYGIRSGHRLARNLADMPGFSRPVPYRRYAIPGLTPPEIGDVVEFILAGEGLRTDADAATRGAAVFSGKGSASTVTRRTAPGIISPARPICGTRLDERRRVAPGHCGYRRLRPRGSLPGLGRSPAPGGHPVHRGGPAPRLATGDA